MQQAVRIDPGCRNPVIEAGQRCDLSGLHGAEFALQSQCPQRVDRSHVKRIGEVETRLCHGISNRLVNGQMRTREPALSVTEPVADAVDVFFADPERVRLAGEREHRVCHQAKPLAHQAMRKRDILEPDVNTIGELAHKVKELNL